MPRGRKRSVKRGKERRSQTLTDFFPVEHSSKKPRLDATVCPNGCQLDQIAKDIATCVDATASFFVENSDSSLKTKQQRKQRWSTLKEFYPVRRSSRRPESEIKKVKLQEIEEVLLSGVERGLEVRHIDGKGRGVIAAKPFRRGDFVVEYRGDLIDHAEAKRREAIYAQDSTVGCYMYYFQYKNQPYCVDATAETIFLGRLVNHSAKDPNCVTRAMEANGKAHLILVASRDIVVGEELLYDYGDRSRESVEANPWLLNS